MPNEMTAVGFDAQSPAGAGANCMSVTRLDDARSSELEAPMRQAQTQVGLSSDEFRDVMGHFASGVAVITARHQDVAFGTTSSAVTSLSLEPPMLLICMNRTSTTGVAIAASRRFTVNVLAEEQMDLARRFASKGGDKFEGLDVTVDDHGVPLLAGSLATLQCRVENETSGGTHLVFLAEVERASASPGSPLAYWRGRFGRLHIPRSTPADTDGVQDALRALAGIEAGAAAIVLGGSTINVNLTKAMTAAATAADAPPTTVRAWTDVARSLHAPLVALARSESLNEAYEAVRVPPVALSGDGLARLPDLATSHAVVVEAYRRGDLSTALKIIRDRFDAVVEIVRDDPGPGERG